jgi:hypothetical protein
MGKTMLEVDVQTALLVKLSRGKTKASTKDSTLIAVRF